MSEQIDIAVDLGAVPAPLPEIVSLRQFAANPPLPPPQIIESVLHHGCKMILGGTCTSNKLWCLQNARQISWTPASFWKHSACDAGPTEQFPEDHAAVE